MEPIRVQNDVKPIGGLDDKKAANRTCLVWFDPAYLGHVIIELMGSDD